MDRAIRLGKLEFLLRAEEGQVLVLTAVATTVLMLMVALGVDVGYLRYQKQQMQKAADAGAIGGAAALLYKGDYTDAARNDTSANGFTHGSDGVNVTVNSPPSSGGYGTDYVEVIVSKPQPTFFMKVAGIATVNVRARAVATSARNGAGCIYALDPNNDSGTFLVDGNVAITSACGILINSSSSSALTKKGASGSVTVNGGATIGIVGGYSGTGFSPTPITGISHFSDPLAGVPVPTYSSTCDSNHTNLRPKNGDTLQPGTYCGTLRLTGNGTVYVAPGQYTIIGGINMTGSMNLQEVAGSTGELFYLTGNSSYPYSGISMTGSGSMSLSAQSTGDQAGILFFEDRSIAAGTFTDDIGGTAGQGLKGTLYFPRDNLRYRGTPDLVAYQLIVGWTLDFRGDTKVNDNYADLGGKSPIRTSALAE